MTHPRRDGCTVASHAPDLSEFESYAGRKGPRCGVAIALDQLSDADRRDLLAALAAPHINAPQIVKWARKRDVGLSNYVVGNHRRGACSCDR